MRSVDHLEYWETIISDSNDLLVDEFRSKENVVKLLNIVSMGKEILDTNIILLAKIRLLDTATGTFLDSIGETFGVPREDLSDEDYRTLLKIRAYRVKSTGTRPDILDVISRFTGTETKLINTYVGANKSFDIAFYKMCLNINASVGEIEKLFPLISSYRLLEKGGKPFGYTSLYSQEPESEIFLGFGSVFDETSSTQYGGGRLASLITSRG